MLKLSFVGTVLTEVTVFQVLKELMVRHVCERGGVGAGSVWGLVNVHVWVCPLHKHTH